MSHDGSHFGHRALQTEPSQLVWRAGVGLWQVGVGLSRAGVTTTISRARAVSFWLAVALPWVILGLSVGGYVVSHPEVVAGLFAVTLLCAFVGHNHARAANSPARD